MKNQWKKAQQIARSIEQGKTTKVSLEVMPLVFRAVYLRSAEDWLVAKQVRLADYAAMEDMF